MIQFYYQSSFETLIWRADVTCNTLSTLKMSQDHSTKGDLFYSSSKVGSAWQMKLFKEMFSSFPFNDRQKQLNHDKMKAALIDATASEGVSEGVLHFRWIPPLSSHRWKVIIKLTQTGEESTQPERELTGMHFSSNNHFSLDVF